MNLDLSKQNQRLALSRDEAAMALGVSVRTVDALIADRHEGFPVARVGRKVLIPVAALENWLVSRTGKSGEV